MKRPILLAALILVFAAPSAAQPAKRKITVDDIYRIQNVSAPRLSPDGQWVAYVVSKPDPKRDAGDSDVWMTRVDGDGRDAIRLTSSEKSESTPRWSPDGRYLAFMSARDGKSQVWLLDRRGGEAVKLTDEKQGVNTFSWSPDSTRLALVMTDPDPAQAEDEDEKDAKADAAKKDSPKPIVITRLQFKRDGEGFLTDRRDHIYVFDIASKKTTQLTKGPYDDGSVVWSPDGKNIAFVSNRTQEPDANENSDIFMVPAAGGETKAVVATPASEDSPVFSPDGRWLGYIIGGDPKNIWYDTNNLALADLQNPKAAPRILTDGVDRNVDSPRFSRDGKSVFMLLEDAGYTHLSCAPVDGGTLARLTTGHDINGYDLSGDTVVVLESRATYPSEISRVMPDGLKRVTRVNDKWLAEVMVAPVTRFKSKSSDGAEIDAFLTMPPDKPNGKKLPTLLRIHGGPVSQYGETFSMEWQIFAANGYAVVAANPRGSSGRGAAFSREIFADWGNKDYLDVMGAVDHVIAQGVADPDRLGVGGWSYGGILTNYVITKTTRFKGAISGASEVNYLANYGHDHYLIQWEAELGLPWEKPDVWMKLSPFFQVDKVKTPTLILCGQEDWNVPLINSEQLYQALR
ncbi:MAG: S9 family peptidase, partial [Acidobacteriota bacterium]|nr:S9 family peptidase [Acidobacteriota bacterium]